MRRRRRRGPGRRWDQAWGSPRGWRGGPNDVTSPDPSESAQGCAARHVTGRSVPLNRHATTTCKRYRVGREAASGLGQALGPPPPTRLPIANVHADRRISMRKSNVRSQARECAGRARPHRTGPRHGECGAATRPTRRPDWWQATEEVWRRRGFTDVHGSALQHLTARVGWPGRPGPGEATGLGQLSGLLPAGDLLMYTVSRGAGRWLVRARGRIRGSGCCSLLALCRPVLAVADRAGSIAPIGVQLVKYVLHLLNGTGRPARGGGCPHSNRRGSGAGRPPWL
jgi:hypothetical protein